MHYSCKYLARNTLILQEKTLFFCERLAGNKWSSAKSYNNYIIRATKTWSLQIFYESSNGWCKMWQRSFWVACDATGTQQRNLQSLKICLDLIKGALKNPKVKYNHQKSMITFFYVFDSVTLFFIECPCRWLSQQYVPFFLQFFGTKFLNASDDSFRQSFLCSK